MKKIEFNKIVKKFEYKRKDIEISEEEEIRVKQLISDYMENRVYLSEKQLERIIQAKNKTRYRDRGACILKG